MADFTTRRAGMQRRLNLQEQAGDTALLSATAPRVFSPVDPGAGRAQRIRDIMQKNQLFSGTTSALRGAQDIEAQQQLMGMRRSQEARATERLGMDKANQKFNRDLAKERLGMAKTKEKTLSRIRKEDIARADAIRKADIARADKIMSRERLDKLAKERAARVDRLLRMGFTPDSIAKFMAGYEGGGGMSRKIDGATGGLTQDVSTPKSRAMIGNARIEPDVSTPQSRADSPALVLEEQSSVQQGPIAKREQQQQETEATSTPSVASTTVAEQRRAPRTERTVVTPSGMSRFRKGETLANRTMPQRDMMSLEGMEARVGNKNNVPGVWVRDPQTNKQQFIGESQLKEYYGPDFVLPEQSAQRTEGGIRFRANTFELPTTQAGERARREASPAEDKRVLNAPDDTRETPSASGTQVTAPEQTGKTGIGVLKRVPQKTTRSGVMRRQDYTKVMDSLASTLSGAGIPRERLYGDLDEPTAELRSIAQSMNLAQSRGQDPDAVLRNIIQKQKEGQTPQKSGPAPTEEAMDLDTSNNTPDVIKSKAEAIARDLKSGPGPYGGARSRIQDALKNTQKNGALLAQAYKEATGKDLHMVTFPKTKRGTKGSLTYNLFSDKILEEKGIPKEMSPEMKRSQYDKLYGGPGSFDHDYYNFIFSDAVPSRIKNAMINEIKKIAPERSFAKATEKLLKMRKK